MRAVLLGICLCACASSPPPRATDAAVDLSSPEDSAAPDVSVDRPADGARFVDRGSVVDDASPRCGATVAPLDARFEQLVRVTSPSWNSTAAALDRFARDGSGAWRPVGPRITAVLGRTGLGWGRGLHGADAPDGCAGPLKREGDGRSPAGIFALGEVYGDRAGALPVPYTVVTPTWRCPDDPSSTYYNRVLDGASVTPDWSSAETMVRGDGLYRWVVFVRHNVGPAVPRMGSCIFLHIWRGVGSTTVGCTAMERADLETVISWLRPDRAALVSLPEPVYDTVREAWGLPAR